ncbi:MAG: hypothetical protein Ct9H300mP21_07140 [Pseudomonadota bacterium]|nr:MAG: hypothetical protein Ct9H300mP21_07140 [Pseudomonadota bacterium]
MNFGENGDCLGWIIGEEGKGISSMFMMMNGARIFTGLIGLSLAGAAYENAKLTHTSVCRAQIFQKFVIKMHLVLQLSNIRRYDSI